RVVTDKEQDLTREPEMIKAYRDTWQLGVHSYLSYLRQRLILARELLSDSGSLFLQMNDVNLHLVRNILDEVFSPNNFIGFITFRKKNMPFGAQYIEGMSDYLLWYARDREITKYRPLFTDKDVQGASRWNIIQYPDGSQRKMTSEEWNN